MRPPTTPSMPPAAPGRFGPGSPVEDSVRDFATVPPIEGVHAMVVVATLEILRARGHMERYRAEVTRRKATWLLELTAGEWLDLPMMTTHCEALEGTGLSAEEAFACGTDLGKRSYGTLLATLMRLSSHLGATPWTALRQAPKIWERSYHGSAVVPFREDARHARLEFWRNPLGRIAAYRNMLAGATCYGLGLFTPEVQSEILGPKDSGESFAMRFTFPRL